LPCTSPRIEEKVKKKKKSRPERILKYFFQDNLATTNSFKMDADSGNQDR